MVDGEPYFVGKDVAEILGYSNPQKAIRDHVDEEDRTVNESFTVNGTMGMLINESGLYSLILRSQLPSAKRFKRWVTSEVLPAIRKTGKYAIEKPKSVAEMCLLNAQALVDQERRLASIDTEISEIKAQMQTRPTGWYTVAGYASVLGMNLDIKTAGSLGIKASKLSRKLGKKITTTPDPRFGTVNVYCPEVLKQVFEEME